MSEGVFPAIKINLFSLSILSMLANLKSMFSVS